MCGIEAATLSSISTGMQIAGAVSGAFGANEQATAQQGAYQYEAKVAQNNAQFAEWQAQTLERNIQPIEWQAQTIERNIQSIEWQAQTIERQAEVAGWQADDAIMRGRESEQRLRFKTATLKGGQRARLAASGVDVSEGSALNILTETDMMGEIDAQTIRLDAAREAWGYKNQRLSYLDQAWATREQKRNVSDQAWATREQKRGVSDQAWAARTQGSNYTSEAGFKAATADGINPNGAAFNTLLGGATQVASRWYNPRSAAVVDPTNTNFQVGTPGYSGTYLEFDP